MNACSLVAFAAFIASLLVHVHGDPKTVTWTFDDYNVQNTTKRKGELEGDAYDDLKFETEMTSQEKRPDEPTIREVSALLEENMRKLVKEAEAQGDELDPTRVKIRRPFIFYDLVSWQNDVRKCCPLRWWYSCPSISRRYSCFYNNNDGQHEWCCPVWPSVRIAQCKCCKCAVLTSDCAHPGHCHSRYSRVGFIAVCFRNGIWGYFKWMVKYLPSSCYCRIH